MEIYRRSWIRRKEHSPLWDNSIALLKHNLITSNRAKKASCRVISRSKRMIKLMIVLISLDCRTKGVIAMLLLLTITRLRRYLIVLKKWEWGFKALIRITIMRKTFKILWVNLLKKTHKMDRNTGLIIAGFQGMIRNKHSKESSIKATMIAVI